MCHVKVSSESHSTLKEYYSILAFPNFLVILGPKYRFFSCILHRVKLYIGCYKWISPKEDWILLIFRQGFSSQQRFFKAKIRIDAVSLAFLNLWKTIFEWRWPLFSSREMHCSSLYTSSLSFWLCFCSLSTRKFMSTWRQMGILSAPMMCRLSTSGESTKLPARYYECHWGDILIFKDCDFEVE